jgi:hypothetical protein
MSTREFAKATTTRTVKFATFTIPAGTELEIRDVFFDRNDMPTAIAYHGEQRIQVPANVFPKGTFRGWVASDLLR